MGEKVRLYEFENGHFDIDPEEHKVLDPLRATKRRVFEGFINVIRIFIFVAIISSVLIMAGAFLDRFADDSRFVKVLQTSIVAGVMGFAYAFFLSFKSLGKSILKPKLRSPESSLQCFFDSIDNDLFRRAYNLLTDEARKLGNIPVLRKSELEKKMPVLTIEDLESFTAFWNGINFRWQARLKDQPITKNIIEMRNIDDNTVLIDLEMKVLKSQGVTDEFVTSFRTRFLMVKRSEMWFLANGFFWPQPHPQPIADAPPPGEPEYTSEAWESRKHQIMEALRSSDPVDKGWALNELETFSDLVEEAREIVSELE